MSAESRPREGTAGTVTTIIAIRCRKAVIFAADTQSTGFTKESVSKITPLDDRRLIACAGTETYIGLFKDHMKNILKRYRRRSVDDFRIINEAAASYRNDTARIAEATSRHASRPTFYPQAIYATCDNKNECRLFQTDPNLEDPFLEVLPPLNRATVGSGGLSASVFLRSVEDLMSKVDPTLTDLNWTEFSPRLVSQLCFVLIRRISYIDPYTSVRQQIFRLDAKGSHILNPKEVFDNAEEGMDNAYLTVLARTIQEEVDHAKIQKLIQLFRGPDLLKKYFS